MADELKNYISNCHIFTEEELTDIVGFFGIQKFPRKTVLLRAGEICKFEAFIVKGCIKTYFIDQSGAEVILTFATENWWVSDLHSFQEEIASKMYIETMEEVEIMMLNKKAKLELLEKHPKMERMFRSLVQRHLYAYQERLFGNIALTAEERYTNFLAKYPALPQRIPQHLIASYLGMSAEFLSRLRKRKRTK